MTETQNDPTLTLSAQIEALLFVSPAPLTPAQIAKVLDIPTRLVEKGLDDLTAECSRRGIRLQRHQGRVQLISAPEAAQTIESLLGLESSGRLSNAALEALAIVAYKQPITRPQVDAVRGVNSDGVLKSLLNKGLIEEVGRAETMGRPVLYATTTDFLQHFGLSSLEDLPSLDAAEMQGEVKEAG
jgi:segregation and condensation protein B